MAFIEVHPKGKPAEILLLNVGDIEYAYQDPEDENGAVIRLHGDGRNTIDLSETYEQLKTLIARSG
jgi:hypothetical protein